MLVFYLSSVTLLGATVTTRHFSPYAAAVEQARRATDGHHTFTTQEIILRTNGVETCAKRARRPITPVHRGGRHA